jgi:hypothetical protein
MCLRFLVVLLAFSFAFGQSSASSSTAAATTSAAVNINSPVVVRLFLENMRLRISQYLTKDVSTPRYINDLCSSVEQNLKDTKNDTELVDLQARFADSSICTDTSNTRLWIWESEKDDDDERIRQLVKTQMDLQKRISKIDLHQAQQTHENEKNELLQKIDRLELELEFERGKILLQNYAIVAVLAVAAFEFLKAAYRYLHLRFVVKPAVDRVDLETLNEIDEKKKSKCKKLWGLEQKTTKGIHENQGAEIVLGKYRKLDKLGSGAFGSVFLVENVQDGRRFAMKEAEASVWSKNELMEVQVMSRLNIVQHVVCLHEAVITTGNKMLIVMDYAAGGDLRHRIQRQRMSGQYFEQTQVLRWFKQACEGLRDLLSYQILHRDLKPDNLFLDASSNILIGDFGLSCELDNAKGLSRAKLGSTVYLSPERINQQAYGHGADVWALGVILYEMLTLHHPFFMQGDDMKAIKKRINAGKFAPIPEQYSKEMHELLNWCLQVDPKKRKDVHEVLDHPLLSNKAKYKAIVERLKHPQIKTFG